MGHCTSVPAGSHDVRSGRSPLPPSACHEIHVSRSVQEIDRQDVEQGGLGLLVPHQSIRQENRSGFERIEKTLGESCL